MRYANAYLSVPTFLLRKDDLIKEEKLDAEVITDNVSSNCITRHHYGGK